MGGVSVAVGATESLFAGRFSEAEATLRWLDGRPVQSVGVSAGAGSPVAALRFDSA